MWAYSAVFVSLNGLPGPLPLINLVNVSQEYDVPGLTLVEVTCMDEVLQHMNTGKQNR